MSDITQMNKTVRRWTAYWGVGIALLAFIAIVPDAFSLLFQGDVTKDLWWTALVGAFLVLSWLLEGLNVGRNTNHRRAIDDIIVRGVIHQVCSHQQCPQLHNPTQESRDAAIALFYTKIDAPSREVAFHDWTWHYFSILAIWMVLIALIFSTVMASQFPTERLGLRILSFLLLLGALAAALRMRSTSENKTRRLARQQLVQIGPNLGNRLHGGVCPEPNCPCT